MKKGISIIICCYNSALRIGQTLQHIADQKTSDLSCEVIIVNNASTDNTVDVAKLFWANFNNNKISFNCVHEPTPGLSYARGNGVENANFEYVIFCDDDNWLDQDYVQNVFDLFESNPDVAILGGIGTAVFENASLKPEWFNQFYHGYAVGPQSEKTSYLNGVYGAGMAIRKTIWNKIMEMPLLLTGRKGNTLTAGDDAEICLRTRLFNFKILYSPKLKFQHYLLKSRLTWDYLKKLHIGFAHCFFILNLYEKVLTTDTPKLPTFYWVKQSFYYWGIYIKYWPKHYIVIKNNKNSIEELHKITWNHIAIDYLKYNFNSIKIFNKIVDFKTTQ